MIIKNVSGKTLKYLYTWKNPLYQDSNDYNIVGRHEVIKTITRPIPTYTSAFVDNKDGGYLRGFAEYYREVWGGSILKDEYRENRPNYTVAISYELYDIELTERGLKKVIDRYEQHRRIAERYATLLPTND